MHLGHISNIYNYWIKCTFRKKNPLEIILKKFLLFIFLESSKFCLNLSTIKIMMQLSIFNISFTINGGQMDLTNVLKAKIV